ncbi:unnamed protein product [Absidia cylindrospora]
MGTSLMNAYVQNKATTNMDVVGQNDDSTHIEEWCAEATEMFDVEHGDLFALAIKKLQGEFGDNDCTKIKDYLNTSERNLGVLEPPLA